ncbi:MAG: hypothetical protein JST54_21590 [Deltaproteobacteria bacterium]|nr:hypothetical protein [Deltaproteobacteria bacterium]
MTIRLTLIDLSSGERSQTYDLPPEALPDAFSPGMAVELGAREWRIERAEPPTRAEWDAKGSLELFVRELVPLDPSKILFSLPTIEDALPPTQPGDRTSARVLFADDWRQTELIAPSLRAEIDAELADIRAIRSSGRGAGFPEIHIRKRIPAPLAGTDIQLEDVAVGPQKGLTVEDEPGVVQGGFVFDLGDGTLYGRVDGGRVVILAADGVEEELLTALAKKLGLLLVDWLGARVVG